MAFKPAVPQLVFPKATKDQLARAIHARMPDYHLYEIHDFVDAFGESVQDLLLTGKQVNIPKLGTFTIGTNGKKVYFNVIHRIWMQSFGSYTVKFKISKNIRDKISSTIKKLMIATMKLPADQPASEDIVLARQASKAAGLTKAYKANKQSKESKGKKDA